MTWRISQIHDGFSQKPPNACKKAVVLLKYEIHKKLRVHAYWDVPIIKNNIEILEQFNNWTINKNDITCIIIQHSSTI